MSSKVDKSKQSVYESPKRVSAAEKAKRTQKIIYGIFAGVIALVLVFVGLGIGSWYKNEYKPLHTTVMSVGDRDFDGQYFVDALRFTCGNYPEYAYSYISMIPTYIESAELLYNEAKNMGYVITPSVINEYIAAYGLEDNNAVYDLVRSSFLQQLMGQQYFLPQLSSSTQYRNVNMIICDSTENFTAAYDGLSNGSSWKDMFDKYKSEKVSVESAEFGFMPKGVADYRTGISGLDEAIFSAEKDQLSSFTNDDLYIVFQVLDIEERDYTEDDLNEVVTAMINNWIRDLGIQHADEVELNFTEEFLMLAINKVYK